MPQKGQTLTATALAAGIPPYAITTVDDLNPVMIASVSHLRERRSTASHLSAANEDVSSAG